MSELISCNRMHLAASALHAGEGVVWVGQLFAQSSTVSSPFSRTKGTLQNQSSIEW
jgi:hypothetical protein